jgi:hypothetical protein
MALPEVKSSIERVQRKAPDWPALSQFLPHEDCDEDDDGNRNAKKEKK